jgi:hypothetical protein
MSAAVARQDLLSGDKPVERSVENAFGRESLIRYLVSRDAKRETGS